jgi:hypothetical protein
MKNKLKVSLPAAVAKDSISNNGDNSKLILNSSLNNSRLTKVDNSVKAKTNNTHRPSITSGMINLTGTLKSAISATGAAKRYSIIAMENKTKISNISEKTDFNLKDEFEEIRMNKFVDKIIKANGEKIEKSYKFGLENISIGEENTEKNFFTKLTQINNNLTDTGKKITSHKEENEMYELVQKNVLDDLRKENDKLSSEVKKIMDDMKDVTTMLTKTMGENNFLKEVSDNQEKLKSENDKKVVHLNDEIIHSKVLNSDLKTILTREKLEKDNLFRALINYTRNFDPNLANEFQSLFQAFNNQYFLAKYKPTSESDIEQFLGRINILEKEILYKTKEINGIKKLLFGEKEKEKENKKKDEKEKKGSSVKNTPVVKKIA